jgi:hypothetical protein
MFGFSSPIARKNWAASRSNFAATSAFLATASSPGTNFAVAKREEFDLVLAPL